MKSFKELIQSDKPVLIDFYADWCGPCKVLSPTVQQVARHLGDKARVIKIDVDKNRALSERYQIQGVPTLMVFKDGQLLWRQAGVLSEAQLLEVMGKFI